FTGARVEDLHGEQSGRVLHVEPAVLETAQHSEWRMGLEGEDEFCACVPGERVGEFLGWRRCCILRGRSRALVRVGRRGLAPGEQEAFEPYAFFFPPLVQFG